MGAEQSSVLAVPSLNPTEDFVTLQRILLAHPTENTETSGDGSRVLSVREKNLTLVLVSSSCPTNAVLVVDENDVASTAKREGLDYGHDGHLMLGLCGGNYLLLVTSEFLATDEGRLELSRILCRVDGLQTTSDNHDDRCSEDDPVFLHGDNSTTDNLGNGNRRIPPRFPTLDSRILNLGNYDRRLNLNTTDAIEFENSLFKGRALLLLRPENLENDPYWSERVFSKRKRRIVLQIQGKFLHRPKGKLMMGAEISEKMKVGLVTKGILSFLIRLLEKFFVDLRYSFGNDNEWPRIVAPLHVAVDSLVATPPGSTPPQLIGESFLEESKNSKSIRLKGKSFDWNTHDTYSFSYHSMYADFPNWRLTKLPVAGDLDLRSIWNNSFLRIVMYEKTGKQKAHNQSENVYGFGVQLDYVGDKVHGDDMYEEGIDLDELVNVGTRSHLFGEREDEGNFPTRSLDDSFLERNESQIFSPMDDMEDKHSGELVFFDAEEASANMFIQQSSPNQELLANIDELVPAWFDILSRNGSYTRMYAIQSDIRGLSFYPSQSCESFVAEKEASGRIRHILEGHFSPRLSSAERLRRAMGIALQQMGGDYSSILGIDEGSGNGEFLRRPGPRSRHGTVLGMFLARAVGDRHWVEEWCELTSKYIAFYESGQRKRSHVKVKLTGIVTCTRLPSSSFPFSNAHYCYARLETTGRSIYLLFRTEHEMHRWIDTVHTVRVEIDNEVDDHQSFASMDSNGNPLVELDNPTEEFLHKSSTWNCKHRRILNGGQFFFSTRHWRPNAVELSQKVLRLVLDSSLDTDVSRRREFFSCAAELKITNPETLAENERLAFFLNVYHTMIMHAFLVLGPPGSSLKWISYFNNIAYEVGDDIFSLTELEHCIIRGSMAYPSQFVSRFILPKSQYRYALSKADYRINFALNCGSTSNPSFVFVYEADRIDEQLDSATRLYLSGSTAVSQKGSRDFSIQLPRVCLWFSGDFGSQQDLLSKIEAFLNRRDQEKLALCRSPLAGYDMSVITVKYQSYSFRCRPIKLYRDT